ncbi:MAG TPA: MYXO-CTERM sorting domain-containing protein [Polyangiaceae bacterium]|nr:MYXO-CTERM sorting domain-containing protein [Polyangiaceae bacterium]
MPAGFLLLAVPAQAKSVSIAAGETYTLSADLTLSGGDTLDAAGTPSSPCVIVGNGHAIVANDLTGHVNVVDCVFQGLGGTEESSPALDLTARGTGDVKITGSTFDACGSIRLHMYDTSTATFDDDLLKENGIAYIQDELVGSMYVPAFYADGDSTGDKVFQGNRIYRDAAHFDGVSNWLIGGYGDQFSNVIVGHRGVIRVRGNHVKVVGNFVNPQYELTSPDVENVVVGSDDPSPDLVMEHNVLRSGEWVLRECQGEVRYNVIADMNGHAWIKGPHDCNVHHNIFVNYDTPDPNREAGIDAVYLTPHLNIYNNTFDGGGKISNLNVPAIHAGKGRIIERVSSNAFTNFIIPSEYAAVSSTDVETQYDTDPPPGDARMHYADYNLFFNPDSPSQLDYSIAVEPDDVTPIAKGSDGFAKHDVHAAPLFAGPLPTAFPFASTDVEAGAVTVSKMLKQYRSLYTPGNGSPLTGAGDPSGGANNNIGAIGQGSDKDPNDQFGTFQPGSGGPPPLELPDAGAGAGGSAGSNGSGGRSGSAATGGASNGGMGGATGSVNPDAGANAAGHGASPSSNGGCGCEVARTNSPGAGWQLLAAIAGAHVRGRRRRRVAHRTDAAPS